MNLGKYAASCVRKLSWPIAGILLLAALLTYKLGSLTGGLSPTEVAASIQPVGWQGIYANPLELPLKLVRSAVFFAAPDHGQILTRLPNILFGGLAVIGFAGLVWLWHGRRTAIMASLLFATSAWVLHVSRLASFDVLYLWAIPMLLVIQVLLQRYGERAFIWYGSLLLWGLLLYIPGMVWLIGLQLWLQRDLVVDRARQFSLWWQQALSLLAVAVWLPLLVVELTRPDRFVTWLGLPTDWSAPLTLLKQLLLVPVHLFIQGPQNPELWLDRLPILDAFSLALFVIGAYFYATHWRAGRSQTIGLMFILGVILVAFNGPVGLSLLIPLLYIGMAAGLAYLQRDWLKVFPINPLARGLGIGLLALAVAVSCLYNLRSYFVAWPHNDVTESTFRYKR